MELTERDLERYHRQMLYPPFGRKGQKRLKAAHVLIAGVGGLGSPVAMYLTAGGVGTITLVDSDTVSLSNLNRQLLHYEKNINIPKVASAEEKLALMNSSVQLHPVSEKIIPETCEPLLTGVDVVVDCLDNMLSRYVLNAACVKKGIPLIHGGVYGMIGQITTLLPGETPCLECIFPKAKASKVTIPVFGPTAGVIASLQALETIKLLSGVGNLLTSRMLYFNGEVMECIMVDVRRKDDCPVCGKGRGKATKQ
ncbi:MAG: adenylyltransferase [Nitrospiraceae bacterium]|nr:adenylyltransferase [Nitrospiraceae bacterium]